MAQLLSSFRQRLLLKWWQLKPLKQYFNAMKRGLAFLGQLLQKGRCVGIGLFELGHELLKEKD